MKKSIAVKMIVGLSSTLLLAAVPLAAQDFQGKFTLPLQAQWGNIILQPGAYTLTLNRFQGGQRKVVVQSEANGSSAATILVANEKASDRAETSDLVCIRQGGTLIVRAFEAGPSGKTVYFRGPYGAPIYAQRRNGKKGTLLAQGPELIERVAVARGGE